MLVAWRRRFLIHLLMFDVLGAIPRASVLRGRRRQDSPVLSHADPSRVRSRTPPASRNTLRSRIAPLPLPAQRFGPLRTHMTRPSLGGALRDEEQATVAGSTRMGH